MRRVLCIFLMLLLPLHSFAMQLGGYAPVSTFDIAHEIDHLAGAKHHHADDHGSVHYDNSGESTKHFADHSAAQQGAALPTIVIALAENPQSSEFGLQLLHYLPDPFPERLQRPPCSLG